MRRGSIAVLLIASMGVASLPVLPEAFAQKPVLAGLKLAATRGRVELLSSNGEWRPLTGTMNVALGTAVRTSQNAELTATFEDGSTITLGGGSALKVSELSQDRLGLKGIGDISTSLSPSVVADSTVAIDFPVGRATINKSFAMGRNIKAEPASALARIRMQTPTARALRVAVLEGAASVQEAFNISGSVVATDASRNSFTLRDARTGTAKRIVVSEITQVATRTPGLARATRTPSAMVEALKPNDQLIVYGSPQGAEGPDGLVAQGDVVSATVVFPEGGDFINGEAFVSAPGAAPVVGLGVAALAGSTLGVGAGAGAVVTPGTSLAPSAPAQVATATGTTTAGATATVAASTTAGLTVPLIAAAIVAGVIATTQSNTVEQSVDNNNNNNGQLVITLQRGTRGRIRGRSTVPIVPVQSLGSQVLATPFIGGGARLLPTVTAGEGSLTGFVPLNERLRLHMVAANLGGMHAGEPGYRELELGLDYKMNDTWSFGAGVRMLNLTVVDPNGTSGNINYGGPEMRISARF